MIAMKWGTPLAACLSLFCVAPVQAQQANMSFFVTSHGPGKGADLGGLAGADKHCQELAASVGAGGKTWRAYLSTQGAGAVNARDRIGKGPWQNAKGVVIATSVADLHSANNKLNKQNDVSEKGEAINGRRRQAEPARHPHRLTGRTAPLSPTTRIIPARITRAARKARSWSVTTTASVYVTGVLAFVEFVASFTRTRWRRSARMI